jgi:hypothetical protein
MNGFALAGAGIGYFSAAKNRKTLAAFVGCFLGYWLGVQYVKRNI